MCYLFNSFATLDSFILYSRFLQNDKIIIIMFSLLLQKISQLQVCQGHILPLSVDTKRHFIKLTTDRKRDTLMGLFIE